MKKDNRTDAQIVDALLNALAKALLYEGGDGEKAGLVRDIARTADVSPALMEKVSTFAGEHVERHLVAITCPNCEGVEEAEVVHTEPFYTYVHQCTDCGHIITESEWEEAKMPPVETLTKIASFPGGHDYLKGPTGQVWVAVDGEALGVLKVDAPVRASIWTAPLLGNRFVGINRDEVTFLLDGGAGMGMEFDAESHLAKHPPVGGSLMRPVRRCELVKLYERDVVPRFPGAIPGAVFQGKDGGWVAHYTTAGGGVQYRFRWWPSGELRDVSRLHTKGVSDG